MKTETITREIYDFNELEGRKLETVLRRLIADAYERPFDWADECLETIKKGLEYAGAELGHRYCIDWETANYSNFDIRGITDEDFPEGKKTARKVLEFLESLRRPKKYTKNGKERFSRVLSYQIEFPFAGVCYDYDFLSPFVKYIKGEGRRSTFAELLEKAAFTVNRVAQSEIDYQRSDEGIRENALANGYTFTFEGEELISINY